MNRSRLVSRAFCFIWFAFLICKANAQSSISLYGIVDTAILYTSKTTGPTSNQNVGKQFSLIGSGTTPSMFGLTGTEDLGDGLKAKFKLESAIDPANGGPGNCNGNFFGCQAWVALEGKYGQIQAGLQHSPFVLALYEMDPRSFSLFGSGGVILINNVLAASLHSPNAISYSSPNIGGLQGSAMFSFGGVAGNFQAGRQYSVSLKYEHAGMQVEAAIFDGNSGGTVTPIPSSVQFEGRTIGMAYKFGAVTAKASFVNYKVAGSFNNNVYGGGLDYRISSALDLNSGLWLTSDRDHPANHSLMGAVGVNYFLSKRTTLYTQIAVVNNHGAMDTGLSANGAFYGVQGTTVGGTLGIRHVF